MYPPLFLTPVEYKLKGKTILHIYVPIGTQVSRCSGRIYDRNNESDIDITDNEELVYKLYARKQGTYFVNKVFSEWGLDVLRSDLIERARKMTRARRNNHAWLSMDDEELLRSAGLILLNHESRKEGITLAAISKVFREIGLADELGSGMRNTYKFTKLYSGGTPQFVEGDIFKTIIPLNDTATMKLGPTVSDQVSDQVAQSNVEDKILQYCKVARTKKEIAIYNTREATKQIAEIYSKEMRDE